jgi:hypothetical protein
MRQRAEFFSDGIGNGHGRNFNAKARWRKGILTGDV